MHDDGRVIAFHDARDVVIATARRDVIARIHDLTPGEDYVVGAKGRAILPFHAAAKMVGEAQSVGTDASIAQRRHVGRQLRHPRIVVVDAVKPGAPQKCQVNFGLLVAHERIEVIRLVDGRNAEDTSLSPGITAGAKVVE